MKTFIYYLCLMTGIVMLASCNDDDDGPAAELLLTRVASDGVPIVELTYDSDRKLRKMDMYVDGDLSGYVLYEYNEQGIERLLRYNKDHDLIIKSVFTLDNANRIIQSEDYTAFSDFKSVSATTTFAYHPTGELKSKSYGTVYDPELTLEEFSYNGSNQLIKRDITKFPNQPEEYLNIETEFSPMKKIPAHWTTYSFLLALSKMDVYLEEMVNSNTHQKTFDADGEIESDYTTDATDTQFNSDGYIIRQFLTRRSLHETEPDVVREMTYEYTE